MPETNLLRGPAAGPVWHLMIKFILQLFTWWNGTTLGTRWFTARHGELVGEDEMGNKYYRAPSKLPDSIAERRWVIYANYAEASMIPPGWHGWMHHRTDTPPSEMEYKAHDWQKPHHPNLTGSAKAYRPQGSLLGATPKQASKPDYEAWQPE